MTDRRWLRLLAALLALALVAAACGDDDGGAADDTTADDDTADDDTADDDTADDDTADDDTADDDTADDDTADDDTADDDDALPEGQYDLGGGAVLDVNEDCPGSWDPMQGLTDDEILIGMSLPESGVLASFGTLDDGMQIYFDQAEPIDGRRVRVVSADDAYDPGRTETNVEELIDTEGVFAFANTVGTANVLRVRDLLDEECIPLLLVSTGAPEFGDPTNYPFVNNGLVSYAAEALAWCEDIAATLGEGARVGALYQNDDFGKAYQRAFEPCAEEKGLDIVETQLHSRDSLVVDSEMTTIAAADPQAVIVGSTSLVCPGSVQAIRSNNLDPEIYVSATCSIIGLLWLGAGEAVDGFKMLTYVRDVSDPQWADDEWVVDTRQLLEDAGENPEEGSYATGVQFATGLETVLRQAAASPEGLNRATLVQAMWSLDTTLPYLLPGTTAKTDGNDDAYIFEGGQMSVYRYDAATDSGRFEATENFYDYEGQLGNFTDLTGE